jgi:hypothetical protein
LAKKISITLKIAGASYPFPEIDVAAEELYRHAEREVNRLFATNAHPSLLPKDQLALAALALAMENTRLKTDRSLGEDFDRLATIDRAMSDHLRGEE